MDYRALLAKYMDHVSYEEGIDFTGRLRLEGTTFSAGQVGFTQEEIDVLLTAPSHWPKEARCDRQD
jgi:hypothetical protein